jgi:hypothetical protein
MAREAGQIWAERSASRLSFEIVEHGSGDNRALVPPEFHLWPRGRPLQCAEIGLVPDRAWKPDTPAADIGRTTKSQPGAQGRAAARASRRGAANPNRA